MKPSSVATQTVKERTKLSSNKEPEREIEPILDLLRKLNLK